MHRLLAGPVREQRRSLNQLKFLGNDSRMPTVALGTSQALYAVQAHPQIAFRFELFARLSQHETVALRKLVVGMSGLLPLHEPSPFGDLAML